VPMIIGAVVANSVIKCIISNILIYNNYKKY
jgi:hypothetical protein